MHKKISFFEKKFRLLVNDTTGLLNLFIFRYLLAGGGLTIMMGVKTSDRVYCPLPLYHSVGGMVSLSGPR